MAQTGSGKPGCASSSAQPRSSAKTCAASGGDRGDLQIDRRRSRDRATRRRAGRACHPRRPPASPCRLVGSVRRSRSSGPAITFSSSAASRTVRVIGPVQRQHLDRAGRVGRHAPELRLQADDAAKGRAGCESSRRRRCRAPVVPARPRPPRRRRRSTHPPSAHARHPRGYRWARRADCRCRPSSQTPAYSSCRG